jgi:hypothetical protein
MENPFIMDDPIHQTSNYIRTDGEYQWTGDRWYWCSYPIGMKRVTRAERDIEFTERLYAHTVDHAMQSVQSMQGDTSASLKICGDIKSHMLYIIGESPGRFVTPLYGTNPDESDLPPQKKAMCNIIVKLIRKISEIGGTLSFTSQQGRDLRFAVALMSDEVADFLRSELAQFVAYKL